MNISMSEEQEILKSSARRFFEQECTETHVRDMESDELGWSPALWQKMAALGWHALMIPEAFGGAGLSLADMVLLVEEAGRALLPGPFVANQTVVALLRTHASDSQQARFLPAIAQGSKVHTVAVTEAQGRWGEDYIGIKAERSNGAIVLSGTKRFVPYGGGADFVWVIARGESGLVAVPVPRDAKGLTVKPLRTISSDHQADLEFESVRVDQSDVVPLARYDDLAVPALVMECAWLCGLAEKDFEITVDYAKERHQFGRSIAAFQVTQHKAADMASDVQTMRGIMQQAALAAGDGIESAPLLASIAKAWCSDASRRVVAHGQQIHGGIGFTMEYRIQLYFRRQKRGEVFWGDGDFHREKVKQALAI